MKKHEKQKKKKAQKKQIKAAAKKAAKVRFAFEMRRLEARAEAAFLRRPKTKYARSLIARRRKIRGLSPVEKRKIRFGAEKMFARIEDVWRNLFGILPEFDEADVPAEDVPAEEIPATESVPAESVPAEAVPTESAESVPAAEEAVASSGEVSPKSSPKSAAKSAGTGKTAARGRKSKSSGKAKLPKPNPRGKTVPLPAEILVFEEPEGSAPADPGVPVIADANAGVSPRDVLLYIARNQGVNSPALVKVFGTTVRRIARNTTELRCREFIEFRGALTRGGYFLTQAGLDFLKNADSADAFTPARLSVGEVYRCVCENPGINHYGMAAHFHRTIKAVSRHTQKLRRLGKIEFRGTPREGGFYATDSGVPAGGGSAK